MKLLYVIALSIVLMPVWASAKGMKGKNLTGGLGYIYSDNNYFSNPSARARSKGAEIQALWQNLGLLSMQEGTASMTYGTGSFGLGAYYDRIGTNIISGTTSDTVGGNLGFSMAKGAVDFGVGYNKYLTTGSLYTQSFGGALSIHSAKGEGANLTIGGTYSMAGTAPKNVIGATVGLGWMLKNNLMFEVDGMFSDITSLSNYSIAGYVTYDGSVLFLSAGYVYNGSTAPGTARGALGFHLGSHFEIGGLFGYTLSRGPTAAFMTYGGQLGISF